MADLVTRNLTILLTDIKGFTDKTSHKSRAEIQTLLDRHKEIVQPVLEKRGGKLVKTMGDAFLMTFESPTNAVLAGVEAQAALAQYNAGRKPDDKIEIRVAINQGEVNVADNDIFGEPVNITARIEAVADAGDVFFTEAIYLAMNKKEVPSSEVGLLQLKGIPEKVRVYRVKSEHPVENLGDALKYAAERPVPAVPAPAPRAPAPADSLGAGAVAAAIALMAFGVALVAYLHNRRAAPAAAEPASARAPAAPALPAPLGQAAISAAPAPTVAAAARVNGRTFPSVVMAWERPGKRSADPMLRAAELSRSDLIASGPYTFRLKWDGASDAVAESFTSDSLVEGARMRHGILALNPNAVLLLEIRIASYPDAALPADHPWWLRDAQGRRIQAWAPGWSKLDMRSAALQDHAAAQCRAAVASRVVDGCLFGGLPDDQDGLALIRKARAAAGEGALLMATAGKEVPTVGPELNGLLLIQTREPTPEYLQSNAATLIWAQSHLREPRLAAYVLQRSVRDERLLRLATTLVLTHSNGYVLFAEPPGPPRDGWSGDWPSFWNKTLGRPLAPSQPRPDGTVTREFERGTVVYNALGGGAVRLTFAEPRTSAASGGRAKRFVLAAGDGDLYLK